jgi:hypothetical protein
MRSGSARDALARMPTKADVARNDLLDNRWSVWGSAFGGSANISGNAALGSNTADTRAFGLAAGADYLITPATIAGFALAGGGTNFSVNSLGSGRSDLFQAAAFVRHTVGNAYVTGVLAQVRRMSPPTALSLRPAIICRRTSIPMPGPGGLRVAIATSRRGWGSRPMRPRNSPRCSCRPMPSSWWRPQVWPR